MPFQYKPLDVRLNTFQQGALNRTQSEEQARQAILDSRIKDLAAQQAQQGLEKGGLELETYRADAPLRAAQRNTQMREAQVKGAPGYFETLAGGEKAKAKAEVFKLESLERANKADRVVETLDPLFGTSAPGDFVGQADKLMTALDELEKLGAPVGDIRGLDPNQQLQILSAKYKQSLNTASSIREKLTQEAEFERDKQLKNLEGSWRVKAAVAGKQAAADNKMLSGDQYKTYLQQKYNAGLLTPREKDAYRNLLIQDFQKAAGSNTQKAAMSEARMEARKLERRFSDMPVEEAIQLQQGGYTSIKDNKPSWKGVDGKQKFINDLYNSFFEEPIRQRYPDLYDAPRARIEKSDEKGRSKATTIKRFNPSTGRFE